MAKYGIKFAKFEKGKEPEVYISKEQAERLFKETRGRNVRGEIVYLEKY